MFSHEKALQSENHEPIDVTTFIRSSFNDFLLQNNCLGGILCEWNDDSRDTPFVLIEGFPEAPFIGSRHESLLLFLIECMNHYPVPHLHSIVRTQLWSDISSVYDVSGWQSKVAFIPISYMCSKYILICFSDRPIVLSDNLFKACNEIIRITAQLQEIHRASHKLQVMELYVREIGHDMASSVQATISKLSNVSRELITGRMAIEKIKEAEREIMSTYRIADTLGITVDPDYNIGNGREFDANKIIANTITLCRSEAEERHIDLKNTPSRSPALLWGDEKGIQSALTQYVINAIKYARGSSYISIYASNVDNSVEFTVRDFGEPIINLDKVAMWEFGWRGDRAKEYHVNGSGIGLFTVKKIVQAHGGICGAYSDKDNNHIVTFTFSIPKTDIVRKMKLI